MNRFSLRLCYDPAGGLADAPEADFADRHLRVDSDNLHPSLRVHRHGPRIVIMAGDPIAGERRDDQAVLRALDAASSERDFLRDLNGSFLLFLYDPASGRLTIGNDRFASLAFYLQQDATGLHGDLSCKALIDRRRTQGADRLDEEALFEFLYLRRLLGEKTYDPAVRYLPSAAILRIEPASPAPRIDKYWQPDYARPAPPRGEIAGILAAALRRAQRITTSDARRFGLLLSGGLDSRALLAAAETPPVCLTTALKPNNEVAVAAEVARAAGADHHFLPRPTDLYDPVLDDAVWLSGGMQVYSEAQFMGYGEAVAPHADCLLIGLGFDIFFGGLYLPKEPVSWLGRPALHHRLLPLSGDLAGDYLGKVKYRLRTSDPFSVVKAAARPRLEAALRASVEEILERGRALGAEGYDLWEYLHLHNLSRHYSFPMMASVRTFAECRSPAFENELFDLAIAMSAEQKCDGTAYQDAITRLDPAVMAVRNANTNLPARYSLRRQTWTKAALMAKHRLTGGGYPQSPGWQERSWPNPAAVVAGNPGIADRIARLGRSEPLAALSVLDMDQVAEAVAAHRAGTRDHAVLLNLLLTLETALRPDPGRVGEEPLVKPSGRQ